MKKVKLREDGCTGNHSEELRYLEKLSQSTKSYWWKTVSCDTGFSLLESCSTFFQFRTKVWYFTLAGSGECAFQLLRVIVTVLAHVCQYHGTHHEQCTKTPNESGAHKLLIPLKVTQSVKQNDGLTKLIPAQIFRLAIMVDLSSNKSRILWNLKYF